MKKGFQKKQFGPEVKRKILAELSIRRHTAKSLSEAIDCSYGTAHKYIKDLLKDNRLRVHSYVTVYSARTPVYEIGEYETEDGLGQKIFTNFIFEYTGIGCLRTKYF